jgi:prevent-host-death family protein
MKRAKVSELKAKLSSYLAAVRRGETILVTDRVTPIALLVPYEEADDGLVIEEPSASLEGLRNVRGIRPSRRIDVVGLLRESRDQR